MGSSPCGLKGGPGHRRFNLGGRLRRWGGRQRQGGQVGLCGVQPRRQAGPEGFGDAGNRGAVGRRHDGGPLNVGGGGLRREVVGGGRGREGREAASVGRGRAGGQMDRSHLPPTGVLGRK